MATQLRHGDVLLTRVGNSMVGAHLADRTVTVARGEATGHAHRARGRGVALRGDRLYAPAGGVIEHEEHHALVLVPGEYHVRHQVELTRIGLQRVRD